MGDEQIKEDVDDIKDNLIFSPTGYHVEVYIIAQSVDRQQRVKKGLLRKSYQKISCQKIKPLSNWCYDLHNDELIVDCVGYAHLGRFPMGYKLEMKNIEGWYVDVPLSESIIMKRMGERQQREFDMFKDRYPEAEHTFKFVQFSGVFNEE